MSASMLRALCAAGLLCSACHANRSEVSILRAVHTGIGQGAEQPGAAVAGHLQVVKVHGAPLTFVIGVEAFDVSPEVFEGCGCGGAEIGCSSHEPNIHDGALIRMAISEESLES